MRIQFTGKLICALFFAALCCSGEEGVHGSKTEDKKSPLAGGGGNGGAAAAAARGGGGNDNVTIADSNNEPPPQLPPDWTEGDRPCGPGRVDSCRDYCAAKARDAGLCNEDVDVAIIGAGPAGLGAAREIEKYNMAHPGDTKTHRIVEGAQTIGGRSIASNWLVGGIGNPLEDIMFENFKNDFRQQKQFWDDYFLASDLQPDSVVNSIDREYYNAYDCASAIADGRNWCDAEPGTDPGFLAALKDPQCGWLDSETQSATEGSTDPEACYRFLLEWYNVPYDYLYGNYRHFTSDNDFVSLWNFPKEVYSDYQDNNTYFLSELGRTAEIVASEFVRYGLCDKISLGTKVTGIDGNGGSYPIQLTTDNPCIINAQQVISTLSVGALSAQSSLFPADKTDSMKSVYEVGNYYEFVFQLDGTVWDAFQAAGLDTYEFIAVAPSDLNVLSETQCNWIQVTDTFWDNGFFPGSHTIKCVLTSTDYESNTGEDPENWLSDTARVQDFFNSAVLPKLLSAGLVWPEDGEAQLPVNSYCVPPSCDIYSPAGVPALGFNYQVLSQEGDLWGGSFATWKRTDNPFDILNNKFNEYAEPLLYDNCHYLFFSGTCTCPRHYEYTQGGLYSGIRDAKKALVALGVPCGELPTTPYLCQPAQQACVGDAYESGSICPMVEDWGLATC